MHNLIDFATERARRRELARQAADGIEQFTEELSRAGESLANLAWALAGPVRHRDQDLKTGIYALVLARLSNIVDGALANTNYMLDIQVQIRDMAGDVAFYAFQARLLTLISVENSCQQA